MNRLTERLSNGQAAVAGCGSNCEYDYRYCGSENGVCPTLGAVYEKLARYEEAEEQGGCIGCKYEDRREGQYPCAVCTNCYTSKWEPRPKKTRQDEFLEMFPDVRTFNGVIEICPKSLNIHFDCNIQLPDCTCSKCCRDFWLHEVEE